MSKLALCVVMYKDYLLNGVYCSYGMLIRSIRFSIEKSRQLKRIKALSEKATNI